jgi:hypothetical protein
MQARPILIGGFYFWSLGITPVIAQEPSEKDEISTIRPDEEIPSLLFIEFLGEFETEDGEWTDPEDLEKMGLGDPEKKENEEK